jgi:membrane-associated protein
MIDFLLHADVHLRELIQQYGTTVYAILFAIIFAETGLVVTPFLPGDSLLFAAGALAATGAMRVDLLMVLLALAAFIGNVVNYSVGRRLASRFLEHAPDSRLHKFVKREYVVRAHEFFEKHGGRAVVLARFVPIVRTFLPFVAGGAGMTYRSFTIYNAVGCILWVVLCVGAGYLFGNIPVVKNNFTLVALGIVFVSLLPLLFEMIKARREGRRQPRVGRPSTVDRRP